MIDRTISRVLNDRVPQVTEILLQFGEGIANGKLRNQWKDAKCLLRQIPIAVTDLAKEVKEVVSNMDQVGKQYAISVWEVLPTLVLR
jgi:hypothetical protein